MRDRIAEAFLKGHVNKIMEMDGEGQCRRWEGRCVGQG